MEKVTGIDGEFLGYLGPRGIHEGRLLRLFHANSQALVLVAADDGGMIRVEFSGVRSVRSSQPAGRTVYAVSELKAEPPLRRFEFNGPGGGDAFLEIIAEDIRFV